MKKIYIILSAAALALSLTACNKQNPEFPDFKGVIATGEEVDLGLSVKWCSHNLGASAPNESGTYFAWGEKSDKREYALETYELYNYNTKSYITAPGGSWTNDPATEALGVDWQIPTPEQLAELADPTKCRVTKASYKGRNGWAVTSLVSGYEGKSIFFPATGYKAITHINYEDSQAPLWSNRTEATDSTHAANLFFELNEAAVNTAPKGVGGTVWCGYPVRPVKKK